MKLYLLVLGLSFGYILQYVLTKLLLKTFTLREILINDYGYSRNDQGGVGPLIDPDTGDTIRDKPTFGEYVKSFGKAYGQRVASDPEFAKKMLAGFSAMMMPREGFVPLSPLGIPEFTTAYLAQDQAIEANKGATQKLLESIKGDQELKDLYVSGKLADAGVNLNQLDYMMILGTKGME